MGGGDKFEGLAFGTFEPTTLQWTASFEGVQTGTYYLTAYEMSGSSDTTENFTIPSLE